MIGQICRSGETAQSFAQETVKARGPLVLFTCYALNLAAPCLNSLIYQYPEDLTEGKDGGKGRLQFLSLTLNHLLFLNINTLLVRYYPLFLDTMYISCIPSRAVPALPHGNSLTGNPGILIS